MMKREQLYMKLENEWREYREDLLRQSPENILRHSWKYAKMTDILDCLYYRIMQSKISIFSDDNVVDAMLDSGITLSDIIEKIDAIDPRFDEDVIDAVDEIINNRKTTCG